MFLRIKICVYEGELTHGHRSWKFFVVGYVYWHLIEMNPPKEGGRSPTVACGFPMGGLVKAVVGVGHDVLLEDVLWAWWTNLHRSGRFKTFTLLIKISPCRPESSWPLLHRCANAQLLHNSTHQNPAHSLHLPLFEHHRRRWWLGRSGRLIFHLPLYLHHHHLTIMGSLGGHLYSLLANEQMKLWRKLRYIYTFLSSHMTNLHNFEASHWPKYLGQALIG